MDGYNDCLTECGTSPKETETPEFVDLGLPSGTLWATNYITKDNDIVYLPFCEASKFDLPTVKQLVELYNSCETVVNLGYLSVMEFIGPNGNSIKIKAQGYKKTDYNHPGFYEIYFWLKNGESAIISSRSSKQYGTIFSGFKLPCLLVKINNENPRTDILMEACGGHHAGEAEDFAEDGNPDDEAGA